MSHLEFFQGILPEGARYALRLINKHTRSAFNKFYTTAEAMSDAVEEANRDESLNVYYVTAGLGAGATAEASNAVSKRELYVDIDCGPKKPYADKAEGAKALVKFCKTVGMPQPTIVDSGNGLHVHWVFVEPVAVHRWSDAATRLKALCAEHEFEVDSVCTADEVRVLRVPGTINRKNDQPVTLLNEVFHYDFEALLSVVSKAVIPDRSLFAKAKALSKGAPTGTTKALAGGDPNRISKFEIIWARSINGSGCAQMRNAIENPEVLSEPLWRGTLSIAQCCDDRDWAIHEVSKNHPNYSPEETEQKASLTRGPYTCETFQQLDAGALCANCPHMGKITSPIQLGATIRIAPPDKKAVAEHAGRQIEIPSYPWPYARGAAGGVYMTKPKASDEDAEPQPELIYPHDLYVYKRMRDSEMGDVVWVRHHLPNDGVRDFMMSQRDVAAPDKLRDKLNEQGVSAFSQPQLQKLQAYLGRSIQDLQLHTKADNMHTRFGWTKKGTFVVGDKEYTDRGVAYAPVSRALERYVPWFTPKGDIETWKTVVNMYNRPECDLHAFGVLAGFGSVLMEMSPENGGVVNYFSKQSGTGKTTILKAINSIFGDPRLMMKDANDTHLTKVHRMGVLNGIALALDEMTNTRPEEMSALLYGSTQGRARDRMKAGENAERHNELTWRSISIWSSNSSVEDRLGTIKFDPQGEMARVIEIHLRTPVPSDVLDAQITFNMLNDNYGHAGHVFLNYVLPHKAEVQAIWDQTRDAIYGMRKWTQTERYRLNVVICAVAAGVVTNTLGLTSFNLSRITKTVVKLVIRAGEELRAQATTSVESFAAFVNKNINNMLIVDSKMRTSGLQNEPYVKPKGSLVVRYEPDTKTLFIVQKDFNRWCAENFVNAKEMRQLFREETGSELDMIKKRMGAGWDADFGAVNAYCIKDAVSVLGLDSDGLGTFTPA